MMFMMGDSVYKDCEAMGTFDMGVQSVALACPFHMNPVKTREEWCRRCLLAKIRSLEQACRAIAERATLEAEHKY